MVRKVDHGSPVSSPPVVREVDQQETALQETERQPSKSRRADAGTREPESIGAALARREGQTERRQLASASDREILTSYLEEIARELNDRAPLRSTVTRLLRIYQRSDLTSITSFVEVLFRARAIAREHAGSVRSGEPGARRPMPYYLAIVEDLLGMRGEHRRSELTISNPDRRRKR